MSDGEERAAADGDEGQFADDVVVDESEFAASRAQERDRDPEESWTGYDSFGETRVGIGSADGPVERLVRQNEGRHRSDGAHSTREAARDKTRVTQAFCSEVGVTPYQQRQAMAAMKMMNLNRFGRQKRLAKVALVTIKVIVEWDRFRQCRGYDDLNGLSDEKLPSRMLEADDDERYRELLEEKDVARDDLYSTSQLVKQELDRVDFWGAEGDDSEQ